MQIYNSLDQNKENRVLSKLNLKISKKNKTDWTLEEFEKLKKEFLDGKRIKIIAYEMGRSESAINKFLSRAGIRQKTRTYKNNNNNNFDTPKDCANFLNKENMQEKEKNKNNPDIKNVDILEKQKRFELSDHIREKVYKNEAYVDFNEVISYLISIGYKVSKNKSFQSIFYINEEYLLDYKPVSKMKLLLFANKLRSEENKNIFKIQEMCL